MSLPSNSYSPKEMAGKRLGRYELLTHLASGGMASVYIARIIAEPHADKLVAVKILHSHLAREPEFIAMFLHEARLAARLQHPNLVRTIDISDSIGEGFFLVMEYVEGDHLGGMLGRNAKNGKRLPPSIVRRIIIDALEGLRVAHEARDASGKFLNLVHRDISPHNIIIGVEGIARLSDFGIAKAGTCVAATKSGNLKGKLPYMAPEHAAQGEAEQRSDFFSMGIVLWEALTGKRLFKGDAPAATLAMIMHKEVPLPSSIFPDLRPFDAVVSRALERNPDHRYQSAAEFVTALQNINHESGIASRELVASVVKEIAVTKLAEEKNRIENAIELIEYGVTQQAVRSEVVPPDADSRSSTHENSGNRAIHQELVPPKAAFSG